MKKLLALLFAISLLTVSFSSCVDDEEVSVASPTSSRSDEAEENSEPLLKCRTADESRSFEIAEDRAKFIIGVWENSEWETDITKTEYDYVFYGNGMAVRYSCDAGIFNDVTNNRHLVLSEGMRAEVNKRIDKFIEITPIE